MNCSASTQQPARLGTVTAKAIEVRSGGITREGGSVQVAIR
jgi:hypothetical protein